MSRADGRAPVESAPSETPLAVWRIGVTGGLVGIPCCVGPTVLALGIVSAGTAFTALAGRLLGILAIAVGTVCSTR